MLNHIYTMSYILAKTNICEEDAKKIMKKSIDDLIDEKIKGDQSVEKPVGLLNSLKERQEKVMNILCDDLMKEYKKYQKYSWKGSHIHMIDSIIYATRIFE